MSDLLTIAGSPSNPSRSSAVLDHLRRLFEAEAFTTEAIQVRALPAEDLLWARVDHPALQDAIRAVTEARMIVVATPVYKAAYAGILKAFFDLLPQRALEDKIVFPIATGASPAHLLSIDYALKPLLSALGAQHILNGLYIQDSQIQYANGLQLDDAVEQRLLDAVRILSLQLQLARPDYSLAVGK